MNRFHWALLSLLMISGTAFAITEPVLDYDQTVPGTTITQSWTFNTEFWFFGTHKDTIIVSFSSVSDVNARGLAYVVDDPQDGLTDVTTIYGQAYTPVGTGLETTGFNALSPEMVPVSGETIFGNSGTAYQSSWASGPTALSGLSSLPQLQGFDLSYFQGAPSSVVYAFQTSVPSSDLPVPEPLTLTAIGMGIAGLGGYIRRRRMAVCKPKTGRHTLPYF